MNTTATWRNPHYFLRLPLPGESAAPRYVLTYGLLTPEVIEADDLTAPRLVDRVGLPWLASLADALRSDSLGPSALGRFLNEDVGIANPEEDSGKRLWGDPLPTLTRDALETFVTQEQARIADYHAHFNVPAMVAELRAAASDHRQPAATDALLDDVAMLVALADVPLTLKQLRRGDEQLWALSFSNLRQRIAVELFELFTIRPKLRSCHFCGALFVPRAREANCRFHIWDANVQPGTDSIAPCSPAFTTYFDDPTKHTRERRRLWTRYQRAAKQYGADHAITQRRKKELDAYMAEHFRPVGRRQRRPDTTADTTRV